MASLQAAEPAQQIPRTWADLDPRLRERLEREGVDNPEAWAALGPRRRQIFGIVSSVVRTLDALARGRE